MLRRQVRVQREVAREEENTLIYKRIYKLLETITISIGDVTRHRRDRRRKSSTLSARGQQYLL